MTLIVRHRLPEVIDHARLEFTGQLVTQNYVRLESTCHVPARINYVRLESTGSFRTHK